MATLPRGRDEPATPLPDRPAIRRRGFFNKQGNLAKLAFIFRFGDAASDPRQYVLGQSVHELMQVLAGTHPASSVRADCPEATTGSQPEAPRRSLAGAHATWPPPAR